MPIRRIAVLGVVFSAATGTWLIAMPSTAEAQPSVPLQAACVPWPYRPCPPPPPPPPFCPPCDHDRDRGYREDAEFGGGWSESEEYEEYVERQRSRERTLTRIDTPRLDTPRLVPPPQQPKRDTLPKTGAEVALLGATSLALITGGTVVLHRRRRRCRYNY